MSVRCPALKSPYISVFLLLEQFIPAHVLSHFTAAQAAVVPWLFSGEVGAGGCGEESEAKLRLSWCLSRLKHLELIILYVACSEVVFLVAIHYGMYEYLYLKWVLGLHSLM